MRFVKRTSGSTFTEFNDMIKTGSFLRYDAANIQQGSFPFYENGQIYASTEIVHNLVYGATRTGKTSGIIIPELMHNIQRGNSFVSIASADVIANTYNYAKDHGYKVLKLDFTRLETSDQYNFLTNIYQDHYLKGTLASKDEAMARIRTIADICFVNDKNADPFWDNSARDIMAGAAELLMRTGKSSDITPLNLMRLVLEGMGKKVGFKNPVIKEYLELIEKRENVHIAGFDALLTAAHDTWTSMASVYAQAFGYLDSELMQLIFSGGNDFHFQDLLTERVGMYIVLPHETKRYQRLIKIFVMDMMTTLMDHAVALNDKYQRRVLVSCDEFGMYEFEEFADYLARCGKYNIQLTLCMQSFAEMNKISSDFTKRIQANCRNKFYLSIDDNETLKAIADHYGTKIIFYPDVRVEMPLIRLEHLRELEQFECFIEFEGAYKKFLHVTPYWQREDCVMSLERYQPETEKVREYVAGTRYDIEQKYKDYKREKELAEFERYFNVRDYGGIPLDTGDDDIPLDTGDETFSDYDQSIEQTIKKIDCKIALINVKEELETLSPDSQEYRDLEKRRDELQAQLDAMNQS